MKTLLFVIIYVLTCFLSARGNINCDWTSSKSGVTIYYTASCEPQNQFLIDGVLKKMITLINREDTNLRILVIVNQGQLLFPGSKFSNFFSIAYDTLRPIDDDFIIKYYLNREAISAKQNHGFSTFDTRKFPIDINAGSKLTNDIGIKIIYSMDDRLGEPVWVDIINATVYAAKNAQQIKASQRRDTVRYHMNGWYVSLITVDTSGINKILGKPTEPERESRNVSTVKANYIVIILIVLFVIAVFVLQRRYRSGGRST